MLPSSTSRWLLPSVVALLLTAWIFWLRAPSIPAPMWNVDESIHAATARQLLDGGLLYRDAIDQRTPLSYYAFAAVFGIAGVNNLAATRILLGVMVSATAFGLFLIGRRTRGTATGLWAAAAFAAVSSYLIFPADAFAAHTEWFVVLFTTWAAVIFLGAPGCPSPRRSAIVGLLFGLASLSKQTALTDAVVPAAVFLHLGLVRVWRPADILRGLAGLAVGFVAVVGATLLVFTALGAGRDFIFYTWTYNLRFYGPEIEWPQRIISCRWFLVHLFELYPLLLAAISAGLLLVAVRAAQWRPFGTTPVNRAEDSYLLLWTLTSMTGAISSGRGFDHYFIQCMPSVALLAAWGPGWICDSLAAWRGSAAPPKPSWLRRALLAGGALLLPALAWNLVSTPLAARKVAWLESDPAYRVSDFIREHSRPDERIFVWGYNPDIYLYTNRAPASRYLYCTFQTGLIPWTNLDPAKDTAYAIVPGAMDTLLADLRRNRPSFIVDCGVGPHRHFEKYPLKNFPALVRFVAEGYVEVDPARYRPQGFRLFMARDSHPAATPSAAGSSSFPAPGVQGQRIVGPGRNTYYVNAEAATPALQRLALLVDGAEVSAVRFVGAPSMKFATDVDFTVVGEKHTLVAAADWADGSRTQSDPFEVSVSTSGISEAQTREFGIPRVTGSVPASGVRALIDPNASWNEGRRDFNLHAPSLVRYALPAHATALHGRFSLPPGAYAPENKSPSDGAEFIIRVTPPDGRPQILLDRLIQPTRRSEDRAVQSFRVSLDGFPADSILELEITPGPNGDPSSDWTSWSDVVLETSP